MAVDTTIGPEGNLLEPTPESARQIKLPTPVLRNEELEKLRHLDGQQRLARVQGITLPMLFPVTDGRRRAWRRASRRCARRPARRSPTAATSSSCPTAATTREPRADPGAAGGRGGAPPPDARGDAHPGRPGGRERRAARGAPLRAADRLRRQRHQPLPGVRDASPTCASQGMLPGDAEKAEKNYIKAVNKGVVKVMLEDGDLDHPELPRRPGLRGHRPQPGVHRRVLHLDGVARRRHRHRRDRRGGPASATARASPSGRCRRTAWIRAASTSTASDGEYHLFNPETIHKLQHACRTSNYKRLQGVPRAGRRPVEDAVHAARPDGAEVGPAAGAARRGRAGRGDRQALQDRRDVVRLDQQGGARDAGHRDEPHRRQEQHRRGRRGPGALRPGRQRRLAEQRHQAGGLGPLRRHQQLPGQRRRAADQDGAGRQAGRGRPAPGHEGLSRGSPRCATRRRAWA